MQLPLTFLFVSQALFFCHLFKVGPAVVVEGRHEFTR